MCIFGGEMPRDNSAELARREEEDRQRRITESREAIDAAFGESFSPDYYDEFQSDFVNYYEPELTDQYNDARKALTLRLAGTGNLTSSAGVRALGELAEERDKGLLDIQNRAQGAQNSLRGSVDSAKSELYSQANLSADPGASASAAASRVDSLLQPVAFDPLGDVFANFFANLNNAQVAQQRSSRYSSPGAALFQSSSPGGSGYTVT